MAFAGVFKALQSPTVASTNDIAASWTLLLSLLSSFLKRLVEAVRAFSMFQCFVPVPSKPLVGGPRQVPADQR